MIRKIITTIVICFIGFCMGTIIGASASRSRVPTRNYLCPNGSSSASLTSGHLVSLTCKDGNKWYLHIVH